VVDSRRVADLPLNGRNLADLTLLVAGVQPSDSPSGDAGLQAYSAPGVKALSVNGSRQKQSQIHAGWRRDNSDNLFNSNLAFPFPDAVQEFSMVTSNSGLEVGKSSAGAVNIVHQKRHKCDSRRRLLVYPNTNLNANNFFAAVS